jgi:2'-5' RNA ligase
MRLFAAIDLDERARLAVAAVQAALHPAFERDALRWIRPEQMHLTLVFLGAVSRDQVERISAAMDDPVEQAPFDLVLQGLGMFPPRGAPRALWIGLREGESQLQELHREIDRRWKRAGADPGSGPFRPHLTLARFRRPRPGDRHAISDRSAPKHGVRLRVGHVTLYESVLSSGPPRYTPLARATLNSL